MTKSRRSRSWCRSKSHRSVSEALARVAACVVPRRSLTNSGGAHGAHGEHGALVFEELESRRLLSGGDPLPTPTGLEVTAVGSSSQFVNLHWDNQSDETGYSVQHFDATGGGGWESVGTTAADVTHIVDTGTLPGHVYSYRLYALGDGVNFSDSDFAQIDEVSTADFDIYTQWSVTDIPSGKPSLANMGLKTSTFAYTGDFSNEDGSINWTGIAAKTTEAQAAGKLLVLDIERPDWPLDIRYADGDNPGTPDTAKRAEVDAAIAKVIEICDYVHSNSDVKITLFGTIWAEDTPTDPGGAARAGEYWMGHYGSEAYDASHDLARNFDVFAPGHYLWYYRSADMWQRYADLSLDITATLAMGRTEGTDIIDAKPVYVVTSPGVVGTDEPVPDDVWRYMLAYTRADDRVDGMVLWGGAPFSWNTSTFAEETWDFLLQPSGGSAVNPTVDPVGMHLSWTYDQSQRKASFIVLRDDPLTAGYEQVGVILPHDTTSSSEAYEWTDPKFKTSTSGSTVYSYIVRAITGPSSTDSTADDVVGTAVRQDAKSPNYAWNPDDHSSAYYISEPSYPGPVGYPDVGYAWEGWGSAWHDTYAKYSKMMFTSDINQVFLKMASGDLIDATHPNPAHQVQVRVDSTTSTPIATLTITPSGEPWVAEWATFSGDVTFPGGFNFSVPHELYVMWGSFDNGYADSIKSFRFGVSEPPSAPVWVRTNTPGSATDVAWTDISGNEDKFYIYRSTSPHSGFTKIAEVNAGVTSYVDSTRPSGNVYYQVSAWSSTNGESSRTQAAASNVTALVTSPTAVTIGWSDDISDEAHFEIAYSTDPFFTDPWTAGYEFVPFNETSVNITGLTAGTTYYFRVSADHPWANALSPTASFKVMMPAAVSGTPSTLTISGTSGNDTVKITGSTISGHASSKVTTPGYAVTYYNSAFSNVLVDTGNGNDTLIMTGTAATVVFHGGSGNNSLVLDASGMTLDSDASATTDNLAILCENGGSLVINSTQHFASLDLETGAYVYVNDDTFDSAGDIVIVTKEFSMDSSSLFDLNDQTMIIDYSGSSPLAAIAGYLTSGRNGTDFGNGDWYGSSGIVSSVLATNWYTNSDNVTYAIGFAENADLNVGAYSTFAGQTVDSTTILIRYTIGADADLDRDVDNDDVSAVYTYYTDSAAHYWYFGDFDYDGEVDSDDITVVSALFGWVF